MIDRVRFFLNRIRERLWIRPLVACLLSIAGALLATMADRSKLGLHLPDISSDTIETLLSIMSSSMLVIATLAVTSMLSAYASASSIATPRSFSLIVADDVSQNALSTFVGAFIFSVVALIAVANGYYGKGGRFAVFSLTLLVLAIVIVMFVRWVDRIARLGRLGESVAKVETATARALDHRRCAPTLGGIPAESDPHRGRAVFCSTVGYVQRVDVSALQAYCEQAATRIQLAALPGAFIAPGRPLAYVFSDTNEPPRDEADAVVPAFVIGDDRLFDEDPRFGLIVLSEIASRALSPGINDPGTAIQVISTLVRLFALWAKPLGEDDQHEPEYDRVEVPEISLNDMFDDAFSPIARDGAATVEVAMRLQKAFASLASIGDSAMDITARDHARTALARAEQALVLHQDLARVRTLAAFARTD